MLDRLALRPREDRPEPDGGCDEVLRWRSLGERGIFTVRCGAHAMIMSRGFRYSGSSAGCLRDAGLRWLRTARGGAPALGGARDREARHVQALPRAHAARLPDF